MPKTTIRDKTWSKIGRLWFARNLPHPSVDLYRGVYKDNTTGTEIPLDKITEHFTKRFNQAVAQRLAIINNPKSMASSKFKKTLINEIGIIAEKHARQYAKAMIITQKTTAFLKGDKNAYRHTSLKNRNLFECMVSTQVLNQIDSSINNDGSKKNIGLKNTDRSNNNGWAEILLETKTAVKGYSPWSIMGYPGSHASTQRKVIYFGTLGFIRKPLQAAVKLCTESILDGIGLITQVAEEASYEKYKHHAKAGNPVRAGLFGTLTGISFAARNFLIRPAKYLVRAVISPIASLKHGWEKLTRPSNKEANATAIASNTESLSDGSSTSDDENTEDTESIQRAKSAYDDAFTLYHAVQTEAGKHTSDEHIAQQLNEMFTAVNKTFEKIGLAKNATNPEDAQYYAQRAEHYLAETQRVATAIQNVLNPGPDDVPVNGPDPLADDECGEAGRTTTFGSDGNSTDGNEAEAAEPTDGGPADTIWNGENFNMSSFFSGGFAQLNNAGATAGEDAEVRAVVAPHLGGDAE